MQEALVFVAEGYFRPENKFVQAYIYIPQTQTFLAQIYLAAVEKNRRLVTVRTLSYCNVSVAKKNIQGYTVKRISRLGYHLQSTK